MALPAVRGTKIRGAKYHLNLPVPKELQDVYDKKILTGTLGTGDPATARDAVIKKKAEFIAKKEELAATKASDSLIEKLPEDAREYVKAVGGLEGLLERLRSEERVLEHMSQPVNVEPWDIELSPQDRRYHEWLDEEEEARHQRDLALQEARIREIGQLLHALGQDVAIPGGEGIETVSEAFLEAKDWPLQARKQMRNTIRRWLELHGDVPLADLRREHLSDFDQALTGLPTSTEKSIRALPIKKAIKVAADEGLETISYKTRKRYIDHMKQLLKWATNKGKSGLTGDPFAGYTMDAPRLKKSAKSVDKGFTVEEVDAILDAATQYDPDLMDHWMPLLGAYTGARREELGQLLAEDVRTEGNIAYLRISDLDEDQKVKNRHSVRLVPLPKAVIDAGFLDYVERRRQAGGRFLFLEDYTHKNRTVERIEVRPDSNERFSENYRKRLNDKILTPLGIKKTGQSFHAFRHAWTTAARRADIDKEIRRMIAGRLDGEDTTEESYGNADMLPEKLEALEAVAAFVRG